MELNVQQTQAVELLRKFMRQSIDNMFFLFGYAGTGKTFIVSYILGEMLDFFDSIKICAPTHKALNVLEEYFNETGIGFDEKISFTTIHKYLSYKPSLNHKNGEINFLSNQDETKKKKNKRTKTLIILDECSMVSTQIFNDLMKKLDSSTSAIFLGDIMQLPPVNESSSIVFDSVPENYVYHINMDMVMRTSSEVIKEVLIATREFTIDMVKKKYIRIFNSHKINKNFRLFHKKPNVVESTWFSFIIEGVKKNLFPIILTWRNAPCDNYNKLIRMHIHGNENLNTYLVGDYVVFNDYYYVGLKDDDSDFVKSFYTSDVVVINNLLNKDVLLFDWSSIKIAKPNGAVDMFFNAIVDVISERKRYFNVSFLSVIDIKDGNEYCIQTMNLTEIDAFNETLSFVKGAIDNFSVQAKSEKHSTTLWEKYHTCSSKYAKLNFGHSLTIHKAQGSTFRVVYVDYMDIMANRNETERHKLLYTAVSRVSEQLNIII